MESESPDGMHLFRELLRYFGGAYVDEYYRKGIWDTELLDLDLILLRAHHRQAGSPPLKSLEDLPEVVLPELAPPPWRTDAGQREPVGRGKKRRLVERDSNGAVMRVRARSSKGKGKGDQVLENGSWFQAGVNGKASGKGLPIVPPPPPPNRRKGLLIPRRILGNGSHTSSKASGVIHLPDLLSKASARVHTSSKASGPIHIFAKNGFNGSGKNLYAKNGLKGSGKSFGGVSSVFSKASACTPAFSKSAAHIPLGGFAKRRARKLKASKEVITLMCDPDFLD